MSEETNTVETPVTEETPTFHFATWGIDLVSSKPRKKKGSEEETSYFYPNLKGQEVIDFLTKVIDIDKLAAALLREVIKPASAEASQAFIKIDATTGEPVYLEAEYIKAFEDQFNPTSRRAGGESKKDLQTRVADLTPELLSVVTKVQADPNDLASRNRMAQIILEMQELNNKIEAKSRGPQTPRKAKKAKKAAEPAAEVIA